MLLNKLIHARARKDCFRPAACRCQASVIFDSPTAETLFPWARKIICERVFSFLVPLQRTVGLRFPPDPFTMALTRTPRSSRDFLFPYLILRRRTTSLCRVARVIFALDENHVDALGIFLSNGGCCTLLRQCCLYEDN